jgi:hypothetical protein
MQKLTLADWAEFQKIVKKIDSDSELYKKSFEGIDVSDDIANGFKLLYNSLDDSLTKAGKKPIIPAHAAAHGFL